ncbi:hypothetical protein ACN9MU_16550 [Pseudoduganella sp. R-32]|uniref:hypothetical protein n=1 Tax=Pseudoduganella sp. R-32 TaxID=3404061 RepID=UPI003CE7C352
MSQPTMKEAKRLDAAARRAAARIGLRAIKSRTINTSIWDHGEYMLVDRYSGSIFEGYCFELTATDIIEYCREMGA